MCFVVHSTMSSIAVIRGHPFEVDRFVTMSRLFSVAASCLEVKKGFHFGSPNACLSGFMTVGHYCKHHDSHGVFSDMIIP